MLDLQQQDQHNLRLTVRDTLEVSQMRQVPSFHAAINDFFQLAFYFCGKGFLLDVSDLILCMKLEGFHPLINETLFYYIGESYILLICLK